MNVKCCGPVTQLKFKGIIFCLWQRIEAKNAKIMVEESIIIKLIFKYFIAKCLIFLKYLTYILSGVNIFLKPK